MNDQGSPTSDDEAANTETVLELARASTSRWATALDRLAAQ